MDAIDVVTVPGIAALVWAIIALFGRPVPAAWKPPVAGAAGVAIALAALLTMPDAPYTTALEAVAVGVTAGAAASGIESYRATYGRRDGGGAPSGGG